MNPKDIVTNIVKQTLGVGLISVYADFKKDLSTDPEDIIQIIEKIESRFKVEFSDADHFNSTSINDICKILRNKNIQHKMIMSFGGELEV